MIHDQPLAFEHDTDPAVAKAARFTNFPLLNPAENLDHAPNGGGADQQYGKSEPPWREAQLRRFAGPVARPSDHRAQKIVPAKEQVKEDGENMERDQRKKDIEQKTMPFRR